MLYLRPMLSVLLLGLVLACGSEDGPTAEIGASCTGDEECISGTCFNDPSFPGAYCTVLKCSKTAPCPDNSTCHQYKGYAFCMAPCKQGSECREGYVCDYGVCRPPCNGKDACSGSDSCNSGRCMARCTKDAQCGGKDRCQDGKCKPPCKKDSECLPGFRCDAKQGKCLAKAGNAMGKKCSASSQCATGYCLPTRRICSVRCSGTPVCPSAYVCGLEKLDKDKNGVFDGAEAVCVPRKGNGMVGANCQKDAQCASGHCYYGFCMEGCSTTKDCGAHQCVQVNLLVGGGIPKYKGCLPKVGTSQFDLGTHPMGQTLGVDIPPGTSAFTLSAQLTSAADFTYFYELRSPKTLLTEVTSVCKEYNVLNRQNLDTQISSVMVPNTTTHKVEPGIHTYTLGSTKMGLKARITLQLKLGLAQKGTLNLNWVFLNLSGSCIPGPRLNKASAGNHKWFSTLRNQLVSIIKPAGITLGKETFTDLNNPALDVITIPTKGTPSELYQLFSSSKGVKGKAINIYLVREIKSSDGIGMVLGMSGGIPGPPAIHGTVHSGVTLSVAGACFEKHGYIPAHTMAHEIGHYLGLWHNVERETYPGWDNATNKVRCPCPCGQNMTCYKETSRYGFQWCRGMDPIPDTQQSTANLMFYAAENTQIFKGNKLSKGQIRVILNNPLVGH